MRTADQKSEFYSNKPTYIKYKAKTASVTFCTIVYFVLIGTFVAIRFLHYEPELEFQLGFWLGENTTHIHNFLHTTGFLRYPGPQENKKGQTNFQRP